MSEFIEEAALSKITADLASRFVSSSVSFLGDKLKILGDKVRLELATTFTRYLDRVVKRYSFVKTMFYADEARFIYDFYVLQDLGNSRHQIQDTDILSLLSIGTRFLVTGTGGSGKSILMRHLLLDSIQRTDFIPVFAELRSLNEVDWTVYDLITNEMNRHGLELEDQSVTKLLEEGRLLLLLDGFDELRPGARDSVRAQIIELADQFPELKIIISSRPESQRTGWHQFTELQVQPLDLDKIQALVSHLKLEESTRVRFLADLNDQLFKTHRSFLSNPLLLTLMAVTYNRNAAVPSKRHLFYSQVFDALWNQHDAMKEAFVRKRESGLLKDDFMDLFGAFSVQSYLDSRTSFSESIAREYTQTGAGLLRFEQVDPDAFVSDLISATCMILRDGTDLQYAHRSFQEYFAAHFMLRSPAAVREDAWDELVSRAPFDSVLDLLYEMDGALVESEVLLPHLREAKKTILSSSEPYIAFLQLALRDFHITKYPVSETEADDKKSSSRRVYDWGWVRSPEMNVFELSVRNVLEIDPSTLPTKPKEIPSDEQLASLTNDLRFEEDRWVIEPNEFANHSEILKACAPFFTLLSHEMLERVLEAATELEERRTKFSSGMRKMFLAARERPSDLRID